MKKLWIFGGLFLLSGIVMLLLPLHMQMTGLVLLALGAVMALSCVLWLRPTRKKQTLIQVLAVLAAGGVVMLMACMGLVTAGGQPDWKRAKTSDYAIVLGAAVQPTGAPSRIMGNRLDAAMKFMTENPTAKVILSGGKGSDEPETEAKCMYDSLIHRGADPDRLILEDQSHTTRENLLNSMKLMEENGGTEKPVTLITSEFHQRRAKYIADSLELDTCPVSGHTDRWFYRVNYTLREVFSFVKAFFQSAGA